jgi:hypothetical protein
VELGEIESVMNAYPGVRMSTVVVAHGQTDYLAAYFTADEQVDLGALKAHLGSCLTSYMVPQAYLQLDELPLTANGKVDKKALTQVQEAHEDREIKPPATELQQELLSMFQKALGFDEISTDDDFFAIGGTSLTAAKVMMAAMVANIPIVYQDVFDSPTVEGLERLVLAKRAQEAQAEDAPAQDAQDERDAIAQPAALANNTVEHVGEIKPGSLGNVLLVGATGFLEVRSRPSGAHLGCGARAPRSFVRGRAGARNAARLRRRGLLAALGMSWWGRKGRGGVPRGDGAHLLLFYLRHPPQ